MEYLVHGIFWCDSFGQVWKSDKPLKNVPSVIYMDDLRQALKIFPDNDMMFSIINIHIPSNDSKCKYCNRGWSVNDLNYQHDNENFYHEKCLQIADSLFFENMLRKMFAQVGFEFCLFSAIPNQYWVNKYAISWFKIQTPLINFIIGRRKHVVNIEIDNDNINLTILFKDENVTKERNVIHAHSEAKILEYLRKIKFELDRLEIA